MMNIEVGLLSGNFPQRAEESCSRSPVQGAGGLAQI
jgi:hypothetical protein